MIREKKPSKDGKLNKIPDISIGFEIHQPYRLNRSFSVNPNIKKKDLDTHYFDTRNREILEQVTRRCYGPATKILLEKLDAGFSCSFSFSGTVLEQLERWQPDMISLFDQVVRHNNAETISQPYYHSIASCFDDKSEFEDQVKLHSDLMHDLFKIRPSIFKNTELAFNNQIASLIKKLRFKGIITEGVDRILDSQSPNYLYSCRDLAIFLRNTQLSDDITLHFSDKNWDKYPLTAESYATWLATTPGDVVTLFLDYETFGEHYGKETGILEFLKYLPDEISKKGIKTILPSQAIQHYPKKNQIDVVDTISQDDHGKDTLALLGNYRQQTAFSAVQKAQIYATDKKIWRYLQTSDLFYSMASSQGPCGEVHVSFNDEDPEGAFRTYMEILADFERRNIWGMKKRKAAKTLRTVPPDMAFYFADKSGYLGYAAYNLEQFFELLHVVPLDSIIYHQEQGDFKNWIYDVLDDTILGDSIKGCNEREDIIARIQERKKTLCKN